MKKLKKAFALLLSVIVLTTVFSVSAFAYTFPANMNDWTKKDWAKWDEYQDAYLRGRYGNEYVELYYDDQRRIVWDEDKWREKRRKEWERYKKDMKQYEKDLKKYEEDMRKYEEDMRKYNEAIHNNASGSNYGGCNYTAGNYYNGIINAYDSSSEAEATILAKIIYIFGRSVASQTAQACIGWTVMNNVDLSRTNITTVAPNFNYNSAIPTVDDSGRDLLPLARDIIYRWKAGKAGIANNGRVLPTNYYYVTSAGSIVTFTTTPGGAAWNFSYASPYGN